MDPRATRRRYNGHVQAEVRALTRRRLVDAALARFAETWIDQITLDEIARRAGVTVQTVLRHFGTKEALFVAAARQLTEAESARRAGARAAGADAVVRYLTDHYERDGEFVLRALHQEERYPAIAPFLDEGRRIHRTFVARAFRRELALPPRRDRARLLAQLVAVCDVYTWSLLRRQAGLSRAETARAMRELLDALLARWRR